MAQSSKVPKRSNATNGRKARNDNRRLLVGRIRMGSWANKVLQAGNIYIYETELVHINNRHGKELSSIGMKCRPYFSPSLPKSSCSAQPTMLPSARTA